MKDVFTADEFRKIHAGSSSKEKRAITECLMTLGVNFKTEYEFVPGRKFAADWALTDHMILIEYEGLIFNSNKKSSTGKSGHTTVTGYTSNCEKYNLATVLGYRLLRYTAMNYKHLRGDLEQLLRMETIRKF